MLGFQEDPEIDAFARMVLRENPGTVIDVGANIGLTAKAFAKHLEGTSEVVYAFEPDSTNFQYLLANTHSLRQIQCFQKAVSSCNGSGELRIHPVSGLGNSLNLQFGERQNVELITLDSFVDSCAISNLRLVKIDVEGNELDVLNGMISTLQIFPQLNIIIEIAPNNLARSGVKVEGLADFLSIHGFHSYGWDEALRKPVRTFLSSGSPVFQHSSHINILCARQLM